MANTISDTIVELAEKHGPEGSFTPEDAARAHATKRAKSRDRAKNSQDDPSGGSGGSGGSGDAWRDYLRPARQEAVALARTGKLVILRKGKPVDPKKPIKGVIRLQIPTP